MCNIRGCNVVDFVDSRYYSTSLPLLLLRISHEIGRGEGEYAPALARTSESPD